MQPYAPPTQQRPQFPPQAQGAAPAAPGQFSGPPGPTAHPPAHAPLPQSHPTMPQGYAHGPQGHVSQPQGYGAVPQGHFTQPQSHAAMPQGAGPHAARPAMPGPYTGAPVSFPGTQGPASLPQGGVPSNSPPAPGQSATGYAPGPPAFAVRPPPMPGTPMTDAPANSPPAQNMPVHNQAAFGQPSVPAPSAVPEPAVRPPLPGSSSGFSASLPAVGQTVSSSPMPAQAVGPQSFGPHQGLAPGAPMQHHLPAMQHGMHAPPVPGARPPMPGGYPPVPSGQPQVPGGFQSAQSAYSHAPPVPGMQFPPMPGMPAPPMHGMPTPPMHGMPVPGMNSPPTQPVAPDVQQPPKLSPAVMPSIVAVMQADAARFGDPDAYYRSSTCGDVMPPLPAVAPDVPIVDDGNCSTRIIRPTCYQLPVTEDMSQASRLPLALLVTPFARQHPREQPIPRVDMGGAPVRCGRCRAFVSVFCRFVRGGRVFECAICGMANDVPDTYFCGMDATGARADAAQRPELSRATVDIIAPAEYTNRPPSRPRLLVALDASRAAVQSGALAAACAATRSLLAEVAARRRALAEREAAGGLHWAAECAHLATYERVSIVLYDRVITVVDLRTAEPALLVVTDVHEPFLPLAGASSAADGMFFDPVLAEERAASLLDRLPALVAERAPVECCVGAVAALASDALAGTGGRALVFLAGPPSIGAGVLKPREMVANSPADKPDALLAPATGAAAEFYARTGRSAAARGVSFVLAATPASANASVDLATLGQLARLTGGSVLHHARFALDSPGAAPSLASEVCASLLRPFAFDVVLRVRAGSGLQTGEYWGTPCAPGTTDHAFAAMDCAQSFAVSLLYDSRLSDGERVVVQLAALYTSAVDGIRLIRVANLVLPATTAMAAVFRMADVDAHVAVTAKRNAHAALAASASFTSLSSTSHVRAAQLLAAYRKNCAASMPANQLVLPESLKLLPLFSLALSKSSAAFGPAPGGPDARVAALMRLLSASPEDIAIALYPRLFAVAPVPSDAGDNVSGTSLLPHSAFPPLRLTRESISPSGVYLFENGRRVMLWIGPQVEPALLDALFGVSSLQALNPNAMGTTASLPRRENGLSRRLSALIDGVVHARHPDARLLPLVVVRSGMDAAEIEWSAQMLEDGQSTIGLSYVDFVCRLHGMVGNEMTTSTLAEKAAMFNFMH